jgi:hypothetical protein
MHIHLPLKLTRCVHAQIVTMLWSCRILKSNIPAPIMTAALTDKSTVETVARASASDCVTLFRADNTWSSSACISRMSALI